MGFVGRHFAERFNEAEQLIVVDDLSSGIYPKDWEATLGREFYQQDLREWCSGDGGWSHFEALDLVIHCAAVVGGRLKIEGDPLAVATDLAIDASFFNWCVKAKPKKVIYFSSSAVYPIELQTERRHAQLSESLVNFDGNRLGMPDMTYGWSKLSGEYLAKQAVGRYNLDVVIYRPFSGYGEDQSTDYPFPSIVERVVRGDDSISVWGSGEQRRDFIHIDDIVEAVLQTKDKLAPGEVLNLGSGEAVSFNNLIRMVHRIARTGKPLNIGPDLGKPAGVFSREAAAYKLASLYLSTVSLHEGIRRAVDFYRRKLDHSSQVA